MTYIEIKRKVTWYKGENIVSVHYKAPSGSVLWVAGRKKGGGTSLHGEPLRRGTVSRASVALDLKEKRGVRDA